MPGRAAAGRAEHQRAVAAAAELLRVSYGLSLESRRDGSAVAEGAIELVQPDGTTEAIAVCIVFGADYPATEPRAYDSARRWKPDPDRHILDNHSFCLDFIRVNPPDMRRGGALESWMTDLVLFLHQQLVYDAIAGQRFPGLEWKHGEAPALAQHLLELLGPFPAESRPAVWRALGSGLGRNDPCPCGSQRKLKRCHGEQLFALKQTARGAGRQATAQVEAMLDAA